MDNNIENSIDSPKKTNAYRVLSIICFLASVVFYALGFDKMYNYTNSEYSFIKNHNAYVGGDAYNYIINGTYSTAFFVLGIGLMLIGGLCILIHVHANSQNKIIHQNERILLVLKDDRNIMRVNDNREKQEELPSL